MSEEIKKVICQIRELSLHRENIEEKIQYIEKEVDEARTQCEQEESQNKRLVMLHMQLDTIQSEKAHLSRELGYLRERTESTIGKLSSPRDQNPSDQEEDQSQVRGEIARRATKREPPTKKIHARQPEWRSLFT